MPVRYANRTQQLHGPPILTNDPNHESLGPATAANEPNTPHTRQKRPKTLS